MCSTDLLTKSILNRKFGDFQQVKTIFVVATELIITKSIKVINSSQIEIIWYPSACPESFSDGAFSEVNCNKLEPC